MTTKRARLTVSPERILAGELCGCEACRRDGQHEPDCLVHDEPPADCNCGQFEQTKSAG